MSTRGRPITLSDEDLLAAGRAVFLERGVEATTSEIAKRARISESVIFHRYKTKSAFFHALIEREFRVPDRVRDLPGRAGKGVVADNLFDAAMSMLEVAHVMMPFIMAAAAQPSGFGRVHALTMGHPSRKQTHDAIARYFELEIAAGRVRALNVFALSTLFIGCVSQLVIDSRDGGQHPDAPNYVRAALDVILRGALTAKAR
jgi:AcrR family transcriptional regulator